MVPIAYRTIAVTQQEIAAEIRADDAGLLTTPPIRLQRPPVSRSDETGNLNLPLPIPKRAAMPKTLKRLVDRIWVLAHQVVMTGYV